MTDVAHHPHDPSPSGRTLPTGFRAHQIMFGGLGGHASVVFSFVATTPHLRHSLTFFGVDPPLEEHVAFCRSHGVAWTAVTKHPGMDAKSIAEVRTDLRARDPQIVLVHSPTTMPAALVHRLRARVPFVVVDHTPNAAKPWREWAAVAASFVVADRVVFLTPQFAPEIARRLGPLVRPHRYTVIPNGIDTERFVPRRGSDDSALRLTMLSRFTTQRDHPTLVSSVGLLVGRRPELRARLRVTLAGDGPTLETVRAFVARAGLGDVVELPGVLDEAEVVKLLQASEIYVHSSLAETMSTAVMQGMSTGLPVVATRISGMDFLIDEGRTGVLFEPRNAQRLSEILEQLVDEPARRRVLGDAARADAVARLSCRRMADDYERLIAELVPGRPAARDAVR